MKTNIRALSLGLFFGLSLGVLIAAGGAAWAQTPDELPPAEGVPNSYPEVTPEPPPDEPPPEDIETAPETQGEVDLAAFREPLEKYGNWTQRAGSPVWVPNDEPPGWRPYTTGHWANTDEGWTWVADEEWGWAPFHYGRWFFDRALGWAWMPGSVWAPAWVAWRSTDDYVGWAPLPPSVGFDVSTGLEAGAVSRIYADHYTFVSAHSFLAPEVRAALVSPAHSVELCRRSHNMTRYSVTENHHIINHGVNVQHIEQVTGRRVPRLQIAASTSLTGHRGAARQGQLFVYQPPALGRATHVARAEFGTALHPRAAQNYGRSTHRTTPGGSNRQYDRSNRGDQGRGDPRGQPEATRRVPHQRYDQPSSRERGTQSYGSYRQHDVPSPSSREKAARSSGSSESSRNRGGQSYGTERSRPQGSPPSSHRTPPPPSRQRPSSPSSPPSRQTPPPSTRQSQQPKQNDRSSHHDRRPPS
jgi:hypothetical protein